MSEMSPRQRMINMMYLVLTALLALNISKEVLEAFKNMDKSIEYSYTEKHEFNQKQYREFQLKANNNPQKLSKWNDIALEVKKESQELVSLLNEIKGVFEGLSGFEKDLPNGMLKEKDNKELVIKVLVKPESEKGLGYGKKLREAREKYKSHLLSLDSLGIYEGEDSLYKYTIQQLLETNPKTPEGAKAPVSWEKGRYYKHVPQAVMAFMAQDKLDVGNMEGAILELIQKKTGQSSITVNSQIGVVTSPRQTIMLGDSFRATVFVAGVDTNQLPRYNIYAYDSNGERKDSTVIDTLSVNGSQGLFSIKPKKQGTYWLGGDILVQSEEGEKRYEFKQQYRVDAPMSVISPDKMNVLYTIVDNPVSVSVPGYSSDELTLHSNYSQCKIKRIKNGSYNITVPEQRGKDRKKEVKFTVKANNKNVGKPILFRIKNVPDPVPMVGGMAGYGEMSKADLSSAWGIVAKMKDFDFDLRYQVISYTMSYPGSGGQQDMMSKGGEWSASIQKEFGSIKRGQSIIFRDIKVKIAGAKEMKPRTLPATVTVKVK